MLHALAFGCRHSTRLDVEGPAPRDDRAVKIVVALGLAVVLIVAGLILGSSVDDAWYFRLIPLGFGLAVGALLVRRRERR